MNIVLGFPKCFFYLRVSVFNELNSSWSTHILDVTRVVVTLIYIVAPFGSTCGRCEAEIELVLLRDHRVTHV